MSRVPTGAIVIASLLFIVSCQSSRVSTVSSNSAIPDSARTAALAACGPGFDARLKEAIDVLAARGYNRAEIRDFIHGAEKGNDCADLYGDRLVDNPTWPAYLEAKRDVTEGEGGGILDAARYDISTGARYDFSDPAAVARKFPSCYKGSKPYANCKPKYHPYRAASHTRGPTINGVTHMLGGPKACRLSADYRRFCGMETSLDGCWSYPRGDFISLPDAGGKKAKEGLLQLARAKRKSAAKPVATQAETATAEAAEPVQVASAPKPANPKPAKPASEEVYCSDDIGFDTFFKNNG
ncbi:MAG: hypothetical protein VYD64_09855 [Pseudomonadota bacterium]|nr:hypothetical protein [Pseudomonadota bacterium]